MLCGERATIVERLRTECGETPQAMGIRANKVIEIWASEDGSWTILATDVRGRSCVIAAGDAWQPLAPAIAEERL